jgi:hypothetical protein
MSLVNRPPKRPSAPAIDVVPPAVPQPPLKPSWTMFVGGFFLMFIGFVIGIFAIFTLSAPLEGRPEQETVWRVSNICIASYRMEYAGRLDSADLALGCDQMARAYMAQHPALIDQCLSKIWDIDAAMCIDASGQRFDTAPLDAQ